MICGRHSAENGSIGASGDSAAVSGYAGHSRFFGETHAMPYQARLFGVVPCCVLVGPGEGISRTTLDLALRSADLMEVDPAIVEQGMRNESDMFVVHGGFPLGDNCGLPRGMSSSWDD